MTGNGKRTERLKTICSLLSPADVFADVGCDHGYCAEYMLANGLCRRAIVTDVSAECLAKAERLLLPYRRQGRCDALCTDGLQGVPPTVDLVLIAGMGGMEIKKILQEGFLPAAFVLQPMRDSFALRSFLCERGAALSRDFTFFAEGKYYDLVAGKASGGGRDYTEAELRFGRENLERRGADFLAFVAGEAAKLRAVLLRGLRAESRAAVERKLRAYEEVLQNENR